MKWRDPTALRILLMRVTLSPTRALLLALLAAPLLAQTPSAPSAAPTSAAPADPNATQNAPAPATGSWVGAQVLRPLDTIPPEQRLMLTAGSDTFPARFVADLTGQPRGAVLLLHDAGQHPTWPFTLAALFEELPLHGWNTLAIELPTPAAAGAPDAALAAAAADPATADPAAAAPADAPAAGQTPPAPATPATTSTTPTLSALELAVQARIDAGINHLAPAATPASVVAIIGFGSGAIRAAEAVKQRAAGNGAGLPVPLQALVLVGAENALPGMASTLPQLLPASGLPTLDLVQGEQPLQLAAQEQRRRAVLRQRERLYRAVVLPPLNAANGSDGSALSKRIRGFLQQLPQPAGDPAAKSVPAAAVPALP